MLWRVVLLAGTVLAVACASVALTLHSSAVTVESARDARAAAWPVPFSREVRVDVRPSAPPPSTALGRLIRRDAQAAERDSHAPYWIFASGAIVVLTLASLPLLYHLDARRRAPRTTPAPAPPARAARPASPAGPAQASSGPVRPDIAAILGAQMPSAPVARVEPGGPAQAQRFNGLALAAVLVAILGGLAPFAGIASNPGRSGLPVLEVLVAGTVALGLAVPALLRARSGARRGFGLSVAGLALGTLAVALGLVAAAGVIE